VPAFAVFLAACTLHANPLNTPPFTPVRPVILVHGLADTSAKLRKMADYLRSLGWTVYSPTLTPSNGAVGLDQLAKQLEGYIAEHCGKSQPIDLVGYSMGGIISRYYVQRLGGSRRVRHLVTISSPHHGTWMGYMLGNPGARQMRPNSDFLNDLNRNTDALKQIRFTSIWTPLDLMIIPANSSHMDFGEEDIIWMPAHPLMVWTPVSWRAVAAALRE